MSGFDINRFIDLNEREAKHLICSICQNIFNNAIRSECEHTFCKICVQQWIYTNHYDCPECRTDFAARKRSNNTRNDNNLVIIRNYLFKRNLLINNMINEMQIKCDFHWNGCQQPIKLSQLSTHITECEHRFCDKCELTFGDTEEHNCIELLKNNKNEWKEKYDNQLEINEKLKQEICELKTKLTTNEQKNFEFRGRYEQHLQYILQLKEDISRLESELKSEKEMKEKESNEITNNFLLQKYKEEIVFKNTLKTVLDYQDHSSIFSKIKRKKETQHYLSAFLSLAQHLYPHIRRIYFGNYYSFGPKVEIKNNGFTFKSVRKNGSLYETSDLCLPFKQIQEVMYCRGIDVNAIVLKTTENTCHLFRELLSLGDSSSNGYVFDINSNVPKHRYITIRFGVRKEEENFDCFLRCLYLCEPKLNIEEKSSEEIFENN